MPLLFVVPLLSSPLPTLLPSFKTSLFTPFCPLGCETTCRTAGWILWMPQRKWRESKLRPSSSVRSEHNIGLRFVSHPFLCGILISHPVCLVIILSSLLSAALISHSRVHFLPQAHRPLQSSFIIPLTKAALIRITLGHSCIPFHKKYHDKRHKRARML